MKTALKLDDGVEIRDRTLIASELIGISLSLGSLYGDKGRGDLIMPPDGSIARFDGVTTEFNRLITQYKGARRMRIYNFSGYAPENPEMPSAIFEVSLSEQLNRFVREYRGDWHKHLATEARVWGTENQIREALLQAIADGFDPEDPGVTLVTATNIAHWFRVWRICKYLMPKAWELRVGLVSHQFSLYSWANEIGGTWSALRKMRARGPIEY